MTDLSTTIATAATEPKAVQNGDQKVESRPIADLIAADKYLAEKEAVAAAASSGRPRVVFNKLSPPGAS